MLYCPGTCHVDIEPGLMSVCCACCADVQNQTEFLDLLPQLLFDLPEGVSYLYLGDYLYSLTSWATFDKYFEEHVLLACICKTCGSGAKGCPWLKF